MRPLFVFPVLLALAACQTRREASAKPDSNITAEAATVGETRPAPADIKTSVLRLNSTQQTWDAGQPWEKNPPNQRRALVAIVGEQKVLTTSELVADSTYLEFESPDGTRFAKAKVLAVDYEANLALLGPESEDEGKKLFAGTTPLDLASPSKLGTILEILQIEDNGVSLLTAGTLQSIDVSSNFLPGHSFLTYQVKASMQDAASSFSLPVLIDGKLAGLLTSYNSKDQICDVVSTDIVERFLKQAMTGTYTGFPSLGVAIARTEDASFRQWLHLTDEQGGIFIQSVTHGGSADKAGVKKNDVILALDGKKIDRRGYYQDPTYGSVSWGHLVRGTKATGESVVMSILREGQPLEITVPLQREEESAKLVPNHTFGQAPNYLVKGGLIFQELSRTVLEAFGEQWQTRAPLNLLDAYENPETYEGKADRIIFLSGCIPTPATVGYERLRNLIVRKVNGKDIRNMRDLVDAFKFNLEPLHSIEFVDENFTVYLDEKVSGGVDSQLLKRGITRLFRAN